MNSTKEKASLISQTEGNKTVATKDKSKDKDAKSTKNKQPPFLHREVKIAKGNDIDERTLLEGMIIKYEKELKRWCNYSKRFKAANLIITLIVIAIQVAQVIIFQLNCISDDTKKSIATILPAVTSAALAIQLKLSWSEKSIKAKRSANLYNKLLKHATYRLQVIDAGADVDDIVKIWNCGLLSEVQDVPPFMLLY